MVASIRMPMPSPVAITLTSVMGADAESGLTPARLSALSVLVFGGPMMLGRLARIEGSRDRP